MGRARDMAIVSLGHAVPSRRVTNDDIIQWLRDHNEDRSRRELDAIEQRVRAFLNSCGSRYRYYRDKGETSVELVLAAAKQAMEEANVSPDEIDFVTYVGVGRGWIEPAMANLVQARLGLTMATGFDVLDACASWLRALHIAHSFMRSGAYRQGLIVNCECNSRELLQLELGSDAELEERLASFTVGEAATATIVRAEERDEESYFRFDSFGEHLELCMVPLANVSEFLPRAHLNGSKFIAHSRELVKIAVEKAITAYRRDPALHSYGYDLVFSHAIGKASWVVGEKLGFARERHYDPYEQFGNTVSASVPLAMSLALREGRLKRGDRVLLIVPSAGFTIGFARLVF
jgi:3-oxoacyl-[acyl-carrier-protein] synthase III